MQAGATSKFYLLLAMTLLSIRPEVLPISALAKPLSRARCGSSPPPAAPPGQNCISSTIVFVWFGLLSVFLRFYFQHFFSFSAYAHMECYKKAEVHFAHRGKMICDYSYFHVLTGL